MELHSFLNVLNILVGELHMIRLDLEQPDALSRCHELTGFVLEAVKAGDLDQDLALRLASISFYFSRESDEALALTPAERITDDLRESMANVKSILEVMAVRLQEYFERQKTGMNWIPHSTSELEANFMKFFAAVEKNSRGRYHIQFNAAAREPGDYLVNFKIEGCDGVLLMPPVMQDVFRDLIANARKYTGLGGAISAGLLQNANELRLAVEDSGIGIPTDEIDKVVEFGYRAEAAKDRRTFGGGFGLTKAYVVTRRLGGRMWIDSEEGKGTRVSIRVPIPPEGGTKIS